MNSDLQQFAFSASHDLQEPLRSIKIYSELLTRRCRDVLDGQALEFLGYLRAGATRMEALVEDLLSYTRVSRTEDPGEVVDANAALLDALANLSQAVSETGAQVTSDVLPSIQMHGTHLQQLFQNLVGKCDQVPEPGPDPCDSCFGGAQERDLDLCDRR